MASDQLQQVGAWLRAQRDVRAGAQLTVTEARAALAQGLAALPEVAGGRIEQADAGGVPAEWVHVVDTPEPAGTVLYLHGGGYHQGSPSTHRRLVTALVEAAGMRGLSVDYRLAPEHPFPAALDDALTAYRWLTGPGKEVPSRVVLAGDSAGGGLSAALLVALRDGGEPLPAGAYLMSPWTDLAGTGESMRTRADAEAFLDPARLIPTARLYVPEGDLTNPLVSPLYADLTGMPPMLVHVGDSEILLDDAVRLADRARDAGVELDIEVWPGAFHVFQMACGVIPEADEAIRRAGAWMARRVAAAG